MTARVIWLGRAPWQCIAVLVVLATSQSPLHGQRTWIVDVTGAGDFLDLPPAVAAASPGDTILCRPFGGNPVSVGFRTSKGLTILSDTFGDLHFTHGVMIVEDLPADQTFVLGKFGGREGLEPQPGLVFRNCAGRVHCTDIRLSPSGDDIRSPTFISIVDCASVSFHGGWLNDVYIRNSTVSFVNAIMYGDSLPRDTRTYGFPAIHSIDSDVTLVQCYVVGGISFRATHPPIAGVQMSGGYLRVTAERGLPSLEGYHAIAGGSVWGVTRMSGPAIHSDGGIVELDPAILLLERDERTPGWTTGTSTIVRREMPFLYGNWRSVRQRESLQADVIAPAGASAWVFLAPPRQPFVVPGLGAVWLDPSALLPFGAGVVPADGRLRLLHPVGDEVCPSGTVFGVQGVVSDGTGFTLLPPMHQVLLPNRGG